MAGEGAELRAAFLREGEPEPFALLYAGFSLIPYTGGSLGGGGRLHTSGDWGWPPRDPRISPGTPPFGMGN
ncbi:hypothetical protein TJA_20890 [Thermus sp. LT1-2-5]